MSHYTECSSSMLEALYLIGQAWLHTRVNQDSGGRRRSSGNSKSFLTKAFCTGVDLRGVGLGHFKVRLKYNALILHVNPTTSIISISEESI